ncbi:MAG TPA: PspC domain-containing protein [Steroidobacteraceae bacterium]|nr:PspC domain-containing protein [Steroidobacteraceae bacterium]
MQKVVSISLNGIAYQLEEPGYNQLRSYLERAESRLKDSPDRTEVMNDLEQAIGEKCARVLGPHKTVVNEAEVARIIEEMGPVESAEEKAAGAGAAPEGAPEQESAYVGPQPRKRLFNIREGAMWAGVCNGIAAYINVDVTWVRIAFALITIFSWGGMILVYIALAFIVPTAETAEDRAAAFGMPFNTEELIGRAKKNFEKFGSDYRWRREWRRQQRHWNRQWHQMSEQVRQATAQAAPQMGTTARAIMSIFLPIAAIVGAVLFVVWILAMLSLVTQHTVFGWGLPHGMPLWVGLLVLVLVYFAISAPLKAIRHGGREAAGSHPGWGALHGLMWMGFTVLFFWLAYTFFPGVRELVDQLMWAADLTVSNISETITFGSWD